MIVEETDAVEKIEETGEADEQSTEEKSGVKRSAEKKRELITEQDTHIMRRALDYNARKVEEAATYIQTMGFNFGLLASRVQVTNFCCPGNRPGCPEQATKGEVDCCSGADHHIESEQRGQVPETSTSPIKDFTRLESTREDIPTAEDASRNTNKRPRTEDSKPEGRHQRRTTWFHKRQLSKA